MLRNNYWPSVNGSLNKIGLLRIEGNITSNSGQSEEKFVFIIAN